MAMLTKNPKMHEREILRTVSWYKRLKPEFQKWFLREIEK